MFRCREPSSRKGRDQDIDSRSEKLERRNKEKNEKIDDEDEEEPADQEADLAATRDERCRSYQVPVE